MNEGYEREDVTVDRKVGGPPKVGDKSPKVGGPSFLIHYTTFETWKVRYTDYMFCISIAEWKMFSFVMFSFVIITTLLDLSKQKT